MSYPSAGMAWATLVSDASWACPTLTGDQQLATRTAVYRYEFADPDAPNVNGVHAPGVNLGPTHANDLPYLFDLGGVHLLHAVGQQQLSDDMIAAWSSLPAPARRASRARRGQRPPRPHSSSPPDASTRLTWPPNTNAPSGPRSLVFDRMAQ
ncbi:MAG: carboxylesterase family protein [Actinomycetota bacterium]|nr:carboxylesterase family protein [Actinomycetota bacterium]